MALPDRHVAYAQRYSAQARALAPTDPASAGELVWLATVQYAQALAHRHHGDHHPQTRNSIRDTIGRLRLAPEQQRQLRDLLDIVITILHGAAYRPDTIRSHHQQHIASGYRLLAALDSHYRRQANHGTA